ncbi:MAG: type III-B CRISPR-associated protein Cas10/Cmr2 [Desulfococcaceae bacterium]|jgi:CRISPR-associated protein Cmr2|nr:type III-B CRISPR-associated protein Cas10/Cmr2 [Desulfococcaceae bacterium]
MKPYIVILQFGPVQDFIMTARRTDDYWAGSFLLSYAAAKAIVLLEKAGGEIVFPSPEGNALVDAVRNNEEFSTEESLYPSLPNRVGVKMNAESSEDLKKRIQDIKKNVLASLISMFEQAEGDLTGKQDISEKQVTDMFEAYFAFAEDDPSNPCSVIQDVEIKLAARKNIRNFTSFPQQSFKCTQCGFREPLREKSAYLDDLKRYWAKIRKRDYGKYQFRFKENERLCAVCAGKRLLRFSRYHGDIPSTSTITVSEWLDRVVNEVIKDHETVANDFVFSLKEGKFEQNATVPGNAGKSHPLFNFEGDCFIEDSYDRFEKEAKEEKDLPKQQAVKKARGKLKTFLKALPSELRQPPKYFTIIAFDGDNMGEHRKNLKSCADHKDFSQKLAGFTNRVYEIVHKGKYHGYVIYSGGDEGVILAPLSETFGLMNDIRNAFAEVKNGFTLCAGAAIVHHHAPLGQGLKAAREALEKAKEVKYLLEGTSKNAFAVNIRKRSGAHMICCSPWETDEGKINILKFLEKWTEAYEDGFSGRWYHRMYREIPTFRKEDKSYHPEMAANAFYHILPRHEPQKHKDKNWGISLAKDTVAVMDSHNKLSDMENLLTLLYVPIYIYEGGQD